MEKGLQKNLKRMIFKNVFFFSHLMLVSHPWKSCHRANFCKSKCVIHITAYNDFKINKANLWFPMFVLKFNGIDSILTRKSSCPSPTWEKCPYCWLCDSFWPPAKWSLLAALLLGLFWSVGCSQVWNQQKLEMRQFVWTCSLALLPSPREDKNLGNLVVPRRVRDM